MQCLKIELHAVTAVTAVVVMMMMMMDASTILANTNQEKQENDPAG